MTPVEELSDSFVKTEKAVFYEFDQFEILSFDTAKEIQFILDDDEILELALANHISFANISFSIEAARELADIISKHSNQALNQANFGYMFAERGKKVTE